MPEFSFSIKNCHKNQTWHARLKLFFSVAITLDTFVDVIWNWDEHIKDYKSDYLYFIYFIIITDLSLRFVWNYLLFTLFHTGTTRYCHQTRQGTQRTNSFCLYWYRRRRSQKNFGIFRHEGRWIARHENHQIGWGNLTIFFLLYLFILWGYGNQNC